MLVLSRRLGEQIQIADNIIITVVDIDHGKVRLGISAPRDVPVYRTELLPIAERERMRTASNAARDAAARAGETP